jgi:hypothetical protein
MAFDKRAYDREWMKKRRDAWFAVNGPCVDCGSSENLELDHDDRSDKVSHRVWSWSEERRNVELAKCVARCRKCHRAKTTEERKTWSTKAKKPTLGDEIATPRADYPRQERAPRSHSCCQISHKYHTTPWNIGQLVGAIGFEDIALNAINSLGGT